MSTPNLPATLHEVAPTGEKTPIQAEWLDRASLALDETAGNGAGMIQDEFLPELLIVEASDIVREFRRNLLGEIHEGDVCMMVSHVVQSLLLREDNADLEYMEWCPDFNGMRSSAFYKSDGMREVAKHAMSALAGELFQRLLQLQAYRGGEFPYFFDHFVSGGDLLLRRLPH